MPLTALQEEVLAILAANRSEESHFAGGIVLNAALTSGSSYFHDPRWTNHANRFYRLHSP